MRGTSVKETAFPEQFRGVLAVEDTVTDTKQSERGNRAGEFVFMDGSCRTRSVRPARVESLGAEVSASCVLGHLRFRHAPGY